MAENILERLEDKCIFSIELSDDNKTVRLVEGCDLWFSTKLNKDQFAKLIDELKQIAEMME